ncbi:MAG: nucleotidyltransferase family protein [Nitrococcus mobilis]|nr:nucleotidyltransferase family protein [Nitrococcus mobilis]
MSALTPSQPCAVAESATSRVAAIVLAGDRKTPDAVAEEAGTQCKALAPVAGTPMLLRVLQALWDSALIDRIILCGPAQEITASSPMLQELLSASCIDWIACADSPSASALGAFAALPPARITLLTTADHALLSAPMIRYFLHRAQIGNWDLAVAVAEQRIVSARFPAARRTVIRLRGGPYCGCNLYAFLTPRGRQLADYWRKVEQERKRPWRIIVRLLGWRAVLDYALGLLTLEQALQQISCRLGIRIGAVILPYPEAAVDVDTPADRQLAEAVLSERAEAGRDDRP